MVFYALEGKARIIADARLPPGLLA